jgi:glycosyltransferase involved in cell wall biosynthesis
LLTELFEQEAPPGGFEVIVVDDGSPKPIEPAIRDLVDTAPVAVRVLRRVNGGGSAARNHGAAAARGEYLLFLDDDLSIPPGLIRRHMEIQQEFGPAMVNCELEWRIEAEPEPFARWYRDRAASWGQIRTNNAVEIGSGVFAIDAPLTTAANLSLPRHVFEHLDGFDPAYRSGCQDQEFAARAERTGLRPLITNRTRPTHIETHNTLRKLCRRQRLGTRDTVRFLKRFAVERRVGVPAVARHNNPVDWRADGAVLICKKVIRRMIVVPGISPLAFGLVRLVEQVAPNSSFLPRAYDAIAGAFVQQGWREGLILHRQVQPLDGWTPKTREIVTAATRLSRTIPSRLL